MNIFLIGFMGCGKSTLGKKLANQLNYSFIDSDREIEKSAQTTVQDIFEKRGEDHFRQLETDFLRDLKVENSVISLGGGTPCSDLNLSIVQGLGKIIYIQMPTKSLANRLLESKQKRPLIEKYRANPGALISYIEMKLRQREVYYEQADITFSGVSVSQERLKNLVSLLKLGDKSRS